VTHCCYIEGFLFGPFSLGRGVRNQGWSGLLTYLCRNTLCWREEVQESGVDWSLNISLQECIHSSVKACAYQPCGILRHPQGAITCETTCPFTGCRAHSALMGDGGTGHFCLLILCGEQSRRRL
jgi:hypothetical protein